ncbi:MAG: acyltransferase family protein [Chloroflexota bacterium]
MENKDKHGWVDFVRVAAIFSVLFLHSAAPLLYEYNKISKNNWWSANIYDSAVRMCVPLLFMISGFLLLGKNEPLKIYFQKRISKVLIPLITWSIIFLLWKRYFENGDEINATTLIKMLFFPSYFHLWFLYALVGLYLFIPILRVLYANSTKEIHYYFVLLWFFAVSVLPLLLRYLHLKTELDLRMISGYVGYLVLGKLLGNMNITKKQFSLSVIISLLSFLVTAIGTGYLVQLNKGQLDGYFYDYLSPNIIIFSITIFIVLKFIASNTLSLNRTTPILKQLSAASFGIYLVHPLIMNLINRGAAGYSFSVYSTNAVISIPIMAILTFGISFVIIFITQKIPVIRKCVP